MGSRCSAGEVLLRPNGGGGERRPPGVGLLLRPASRPFVVVPVPNEELNTGLEGDVEGEIFGNRWLAADGEGTGESVTFKRAGLVPGNGAGLPDEMDFVTSIASYRETRSEIELRREDLAFEGDGGGNRADPGAGLTELSDTDFCTGRMSMD